MMDDGVPRSQKLQKQQSIPRNDRASFPFNFEASYFSRDHIKTITSLSNISRTRPTIKQCNILSQKPN